MYAQPGKKLLFMGGEIAQYREWNHDTGLDWHLLDSSLHAGVQKWVRDLNHAYRSQVALHEHDFSPHGFEWIDANDNANSVLSFMRKGRIPGEEIVVICNCTPMPRLNYRIGVPHGGWWRELLNSDGTEYGGSGMGNLGGVEATTRPYHGREHSLVLTLPPLATVLLRGAQ